MIGGVIIFSSWLVEKNWQSEWTEEKEKLKRSQLVIDITEVGRSLYEVAYLSEIRKPSIDSFQFAYIEQRLSRIYLDLISWSEGRVAEDGEIYSNLIQAKRTIDATNRANLAVGNYLAIDTAFKVVSATFGKTYMKLDKKFSDKYDLVTREEEFWSTAFILLYAVGSILLGVAFVIEKVQNR